MERYPQYFKMSDNVWAALEKEVEVDMTFDEAKKLYINCNCSLFVMAREEKEAYDEYRLLNISRTTEEEWRDVYKRQGTAKRHKNGC